MAQLITPSFPTKENSRLSPTHDWVAIFLIWIILWITARRLIVTNWTNDLGFSSTIATFGLIFGIALGACKFPKSFKIVLIVSYSLFFILWMCGLTFQKDILWLDRIHLLLLRLSRTAHQLILNQPVQDNLLFILLMMIVFWFIGLNSGYSFSRNAATWQILIPLFVTITLIHSYDPLLPQRIWYLIAFTFFSLLLMIRLNLIHQVTQWKENRVQVPSQFTNDILQISIRFVLLLSFIVWILPANRSSFQQMEIFWNKLKQPFQSIREDFENAFSSLKVTIGSSPDYYGRILNLGQGNILSDEEVFSVLVPEKPPQGLSLYWRARVYNFYENGQWSTTNTLWQFIEPGSTKLQFQRYPDRMRGLSTFYFALNKPIITLFAPPQPQWTNLGVKAELFPNPDGTVDLLTLQSNHALGSGTTYTVRSSLSGTTIQKLRQASETFPTAIQERYLQLPDSITPRTRQLAHQITANETTEYDKVIAVTEYLRQNLQYSETLQELPQDKELIDWFLFDAQRGFCNYFASAEVILLRSIGIPARLAVGYAQGKINSPNVYQVIQRDAHAWPEVYFTNVGWVEFEPTPNRPEIIRPFSDLTTPPPNIANESDAQIQETLKKLQQSHQNKPPKSKPALPSYFWLSILIISMLALGIYSYFHKTQLQKLSIQIPATIETNLRTRGINPPASLVNWNRKQLLTPIEKAYLQINSALRLLGNLPASSATPIERANLLISLLPQGEPFIRLILNQYQDFLYNNIEPDLPSNNNAKQTLRRLIFRKWISMHVKFRFSGN